MNINSNKEMLNALTSFRFIAAFMVFIYHAGIWSSYQTGYIGVSFFFILSGFILAFNYSDRLKEFNAYEIKQFYIARIAKIYPIHIITFLIAIPYYFYIPLKHKTILYVFQAFTNISLIHSFIPFGNISFNGVSWSLSDEAFFYIVFPFLLLFVFKYLTSFKRILISAISLWFLVMVIYIYILPVKSNFSIWVAYYFPGVRIFEFFIGILLGIIFIKVKDLKNRISKMSFSILEISSITILIFMVIVSPNFHQNIRYSLIFIPFLSLIIFIFAFQKGTISLFLTKRFLVYLGEISFSFYMIHNLVLNYIYFLWKPNINSTITIIICFLISLILSTSMYHSVEEPMRVKVKILLNRFTKHSLKTVLANMAKIS